MLVRRCAHCGDVSVPYFGFFTPCRAHSLGSHQITEPYDADDHRIAALLKIAYNSVPWFDRAKFDKHAGPEAKTLLSS